MDCDVVWKSVLQWLQELVQSKHLAKEDSAAVKFAEVGFSRSPVICLELGTCW